MNTWRKGDRLHHDDGSHRASARSANGSEVNWFEANAQKHFQEGPCQLDLAATVHKAAPGHDEAHCKVCGQRIKRVPGGQGPTYVHADSGAVAAPNPPKSDVVDQDSPGAREALAYAAGVDAGKEAGLREARSIVRASRSYKDSLLDVVHISDTLVDRADAVRNGNAIDWQAAGREAFEEGRPAAPGADQQILAAIGNNPDDHPETAWMMTEWTKGYNAARDEEN